MNVEAERARFIADAETLKNRAKKIANAADCMARLCGGLAENAARRPAITAERKIVRIPVTVKFSEVEEAPPAAPEAPRIPAGDSEPDAPDDAPDDAPEPDWSEAGIPDDDNKRFFLDNTDVVRGVLFCGTLQFSTCLLCAALDGFVWKNPEELHLAPALPLHEGCRCVLLPLTELDEAVNSSKRPAEASDFWHDAAVRYARKYPNKSWERLSASTKLKYYYEEQKLFEQETGRPAFEEVPQNTTFSEWLRTKPENLQRRYLGELRANLFIEHNLNLIDFVDQTTWTLFSDDALISKYISPPAIERNEPEMTSVKLTCPQCGQHYSVEIDPALKYEDMTCQQCGGKIPVSAEPPPVAAPQRNPPENSLKCPTCGLIFKPDFDPETYSGSAKCPRCTSLLPFPLDKCIVNRKPKQQQQRPAAQINSGGKHIHLQCPICKTIFAPEFDVKTHVGGCDCPHCHSGLPLPLEKNIVDPAPIQMQPPFTPPAAGRTSGPPPAAAFFFVCSIVSFIAGDIAAIADSVALSSSLYWSGVSFILTAIYLKIQWK